MKHTVPRSPFAMSLSGSAKEAQLRIRNIVQGPKKRPPAWFLALVFCAILSCGWLVSCQPMERPRDPSSALEFLQTLAPEDLTGDYWCGAAVPDEELPQPDGDLLLDLLLRGMEAPLDPAPFQKTELWQIRSGPVALNALAGEGQKDYVLVRIQGGDGPEQEFVLHSPELWSAVLSLHRVEGEIDQTMLGRVQGRINREIMRQCTCEDQCFPTSPEFDGGAVTKFQPLAVYDDLAEGTVHLYALNLALSCRYPERITLAGGNWVDDQGRLRNGYHTAYMVIQELDGQIAKSAFLAGDEIAILPDGADEDPQRLAVLSALERPAPGQLEFADQFDRHNEMLVFDGTAENRFLFSAGEQDGVPCYRMENETYGAVVLALPGGRGDPYQATLFYQDRTLTFEMPVFLLGYGSVSGVADLILQDLTGDGTPELVYIYGGRGTGFAQDDVQVFDLADMAPIPVRWDLTQMEQAVRLELAGTRKAKYDSRDLIFRVTGPEGEERLAALDIWQTPEAPPQTLAPVFGDYTCILLRERGLVLSSSFYAEDFSPGYPNYLGSLEGDLRYDPHRRVFSLQPPFTLDLYAPVDSLEGVEPYAQPDAAQALRAVLEGRALFELADDRERYSLDQLGQVLFHTTEFDAAPDQFAVADLDQDGIPEVVVRSDNHPHSEPLLILRCQDGVVYGCCEVGRAMSELKADGTFLFSSGSSSWGVGRGNFDPGTPASWSVQPIAAVDGETYFLEGEPAARGEFQQACARQDAKDMAVWHSFSADNIAAALP